MKTYILPERSRAKLQEIWGTPIFGDETRVKEGFLEFLKNKRFKTIITVGDYCSHHLESDIKIFDRFVQRQSFNKHDNTDCGLIFDNPPATIQKQAWAIIEKALEEKSNVCVNGEEDLLVIPVTILANPGTLVVYGFPGKGICLLEVTPKLKEEFREFLEKNFETRD